MASSCVPISVLIHRLSSSSRVMLAFLSFVCAASRFSPGVTAGQNSHILKAAVCASAFSVTHVCPFLDNALWFRLTMSAESEPLRCALLLLPHGDAITTFGTACWPLDIGNLELREPRTAITSRRVESAAIPAVPSCDTILDDFIQATRAGTG